MNGIEHVRPGNGFLPNFQLFKKADVNGKNEQPLYTYLKKHCPSPKKSFAGKHKLYYDEFEENDIRWNWEKFIINRRGIPIFRINPKVEPEGLIDYVEDAIRCC
ncbi:hypothetical protein CHUAL_002445 [Chamberlinius hualienensis]